MNNLFLNEKSIQYLLKFYQSNTYVLNKQHTVDGMHEIYFNEKNNKQKALVMHKIDNSKIYISLTDDNGRIIQRDNYILRNNEFIKLNHIIQVGKMYKKENSINKFTVIKNEKDNCLLLANNTVEPMFVVAWGVKVDDNEISWCGGSYSNNIDVALSYFNERYVNKTMQDINNKITDYKNEHNTNNDFDLTSKSIKTKDIDLIK